MTAAGRLGAGDVIADRYKILRPLGSGGMGAVFEAENLRTGRRVAIKTIHADLSAQPELARRFEREARAAAAIGHPHVVDILDLGDDPARGIQFLVQELLEGESLAERLDRDGPLSPRAALDALVPIADALAAVHAAGLVHRDVKPENVFLQRGRDGERPKLIDFGVVARVVGRRATRLTLAGTLVGSPAYMAPEQTLDGASLDGRADVWSLGVVLYEALSGQRPYEADDAEGLLAKIRAEAPRPLAAAMPGLPAPLLAVVDRALQKDRTARWPTAAAFRDALRQAAVRLSAAQFDERTTVMTGRGGAPTRPRRAAGARTAGAAALAALVLATGVGVGLAVNHAVRPRAATARGAGGGRRGARGDAGGGAAGRRGAAARLRRRRPAGRGRHRGAGGARRARAPGPRRAPAAAGVPPAQHLTARRGAVAA
jgi:hypothetical protein